MEQPSGLPGPPRLPYLPGLDGVRALAVVAVVLYHAGVPLLGGFLGVETFFTLSGFLITALLVHEWGANGRIDLRAFWVRRFRRLLPALLALLGVVLLYAAIVLPDELAGLQRDAIAALAYVMNWHLIAGGQSYFDPMLRPSLFQHLWSLSVEEQFYLLWPLLFVVGIPVFGRKWLAAFILGGVAASTAWMIALHEPGSDPSRLYYGTDTRAAGLLLGVALGLVWMPWRAQATRRAGVGADAAGVAGLVVLLLAYTHYHEQLPSLYTGGFLLAATATAAVIVAATHPQSRLIPWLLGGRVLRWSGTRSYSIYLWHWPIFQITRPYQDVQLDGVALYALRFGATLLLAELSYRLVEVPVRHGAFGRVLGRARDTLPGGVGRFGVSCCANVNLLLERVLYMRHPRQSRSLVVLSAFALTFSGSGCTPLPPTQSAAPTVAAVTSLPPTLVPPTLVPPTNTALPTEAPSATPEPTSTPEPSATPEPTAIPVLSADAVAALQNVLDELVADGVIPGAVAAVSIPGYETWVGSSGIASRATGEAMQPDTRTRIASISKTFTSVVVLQLVEEGALRLDAPVETYLPGLLRRGGDITVRQLLNHTSGLYDYLEDRAFVTQAYTQPDRVFPPEELVAYAEKNPASFAPGAPNSWDYSSTNYVLLGMIAEQATGNTMAAEVRSRILEPLGLNATFFAPEEPVQGMFANGYTNTTSQQNVAMTFAFGTANIIARTEDVNRFGQALFNGELLSPEMQAEMLTFVDGKGQYRMPTLAYGLGVMQNQLDVGPGADGQPRTAEEKTVRGHIGGFGGFRSALWHAPESGITISLGVNQGATDPNILATRLFDVALAATGR